jgi:hypothetical protein
VREPAGTLVAAVMVVLARDSLPGRSPHPPAKVAGVAAESRGRLEPPSPHPETVTAIVRTTALSGRRFCAKLIVRLLASRSSGARDMRASQNKRIVNLLI